MNMGMLGYLPARKSQIPYYQNTSLYYKAENSEWVLYKQPGDSITAERLRTETIPRLFIKAEDRLDAALEAQEAFNNLLETSLKSGDVRAIHASLVGITEETLSEPRSGTMRYSKRSVALLTKASVRDASILKQLARLSSQDYTTALHSVNVMALTLAFALRVGFDWRKTLEFGLAALLHDIGKARLPDSVLHSPQPLSDEEFRTMKMHPMLAVDILERTGMNIPKIRAAATEHHEKMDGSGYPIGKKDVSLIGQIIGLLDSYESLTNEANLRRRPIAPAEAIHLLRKEANRGCYLPSVLDRLECTLKV